MRFLFEGTKIAAEPGDTVAAALYRHGLREFGSSFEYRRPRGLLCSSGNCANCQMHVDGIPNITVCTTPVRDGMNVVRQMDDATGPATHGIGLGRVPPPDTPILEYEHRYASAAVAVVGGGVEGIEAALEAAKAAVNKNGRSVWLIEKEPALGGSLRWFDPQCAAKLTKELDQSGVTVLCNAGCSGLYEGNLLAVIEKNPSPGVVERLLHLRAERIIVATGSYEVPLLFENNDLPGIMLSSGVLRLLRLHGIVPGKRAVIAGDGNLAKAVRAGLAHAGCEVVATVGTGEILRAVGERSLEGMVTAGGEYACDLLVLCGARVPEVSLLTQAGAQLTWNDEAKHYTATGLQDGAEWRPDAGSLGPATPPVPLLAENEFSCFCHDITTRDLQQALDAGFNHIETLKRATKAMKGQCQGRMCAFATAAQCAHANGTSLATVGTSVSRPPNPAISLGALAGAHPPTVRRTAMHTVHQQLGAVWTDMSGWKRPKYYANAEAQDETECILREYTAIRERAGIIDVGTLGKLSVRGRDAGRLLDYCYTHRFSNLKPGRARYAVMCDESGSILDDGMIARFSEEEFFVSTTTSNVETVQQILEWKIAETKWQVSIVNLTAGLAAMNVAGPQARQALQKLTSLPLDAETFPYMHCRRAEIAGVPASLIRIGFVGEAGWEIHFPAAYGEELWNRVLEAGHEFGILPVGTETQRLLRLEKKHVIIGVDTDALATPYTTDMAWVVKLDKEDFIGRGMLKQLAGNLSRERLVGFKSVTLPLEGAAVIEKGIPVGRITSARYSPHCGTNIGLAWVPVGSASSGAPIHIDTGFDRIMAEVYSEAFYDPAGLRLQM